MNGWGGKLQLAKKWPKLQCLRSLQNPDVAFNYTLTALPFRIATPDGELHQSPKNVLPNYLIDKADAITNFYPKNACWLVDGMAAMRCNQA